MPRTKRKSAAANVPVPQNRQQAAEQIARVGELRRNLDKQRADTDAQMANIARAVEAATAQPRAELEELEKGLQIYCDANRDTLTEGGKRKHCDLATGKVSWRFRPPKVSLKGVETILQRLRDGGFKEFIRTKEEVNKEAMLAEPKRAAAIEGVTIKSGGEDFIIEPVGLEMDETKGAA